MTIYKNNKESELEKVIKNLSMQSKNSIVNENEFDSFKKYMHVKRPIEEEFKKSIENHLKINAKSILFVVGNVGDGKSHILSYMKDQYSEDFENLRINVHNDATETDSPTSTALETLKKIIFPFSDENLGNGQSNRLIIAINLGVLTNLMKELKNEGNYKALLTYLNDTGVLSSRIVQNDRSSHFRIISFTEQKNYKIINGEISSDFFEKVLNKVFSKTENNPFYHAYISDLNENVYNSIHVNYEFLLKEEIKKTIIYLLVRAEIESKIIISARKLFNFIYDILVSYEEGYKSYLPYLLFENRHRSDLLYFINDLDPIKSQTKEISEVSVELYNAINPTEKIKSLSKFKEGEIQVILESMKSKQAPFNDYINFYLRLEYLLNYKDVLFDNYLFEKYISYFSIIEKKEYAEELFELVRFCLYRWNGYAGEDELIVSNPGKNNLKVLVEVAIEPAGNYVVDNNIYLEFLNHIGEKIEFSVDFKTFMILSSVKKGYFLKEEDRQIAVNFEVFVNKIIDSDKYMKKNILFDLRTKENYQLKKTMGKIKLTKGNI